MTLAIQSILSLSRASSVKTRGGRRLAPQMRLNLYRPRDKQTKTPIGTTITTVAASTSNPNARLNVLLAEDRPHGSHHWISQLPRLLEPQGVTAYITRCGDETIEIAARVDIHAIILDLASPASFWGALSAGGAGSRIAFSQRSASAETATCRNEAGRAGVRCGAWLTQLGRLLPNRPPMVIVRGRTYSPRQVQMLLREALRLGVFSVINAPVELEHLLAVLRRIIDQQYRGHWPTRHRSANPHPGASP